MRVAIAVPHYGPLNARFVAALANLLVFSAGAEVNYNGRPTKPVIQTFFREQGSLDYKRTQLVLDAEQWAADYLLWMDADHVFSPDAMFQLMRHDLAVVGCNYVTRQGPPVPVATGLDGNRIPTTEAGGLEEVLALGLGFCLVKMPALTEVKQRLVPGARLFETRMDNAGEMLVGEDTHFFNQVRKAGFPVYLDHSLSWSIGHISETIRTNADAVRSEDAGSILSSARDR